MTAVAALRVIFACLLAASLPTDVSAKPRPLESYRECVTAAAAAFKLPELMIELIIETEGGWPGARVVNKDATADLGVMQINTRWLKHFGARGVSESDLQNSACINIYAGTYLLKTHLNQTGDLALAMAYYHNRKPHYAAAYLSRIQGVIDRRIRAETQRRRIAAK